MLSASQIGANKTIELAEDLSNKFDAIGIEMRQFLEHDFNSAAFFPPAPADLPQWTPFLQKMAVSNIYGQMQLIYARADTMERGMRLLKDNCDSHIQNLSTLKASLITKFKAVKEAEAVLNKSYSGARSTSLEVSALHQQVSRSMQHPKIASHVAFREGQQRSPFFTPPAISPGQLSLGSNSLRYNSLEMW